MTAPDYYPNTFQQQLLQAALWTGQDAIQSFLDWVRAVPWDDIDYPSQRLLPLAYKNLKRQGFDGPLMNRLKGVYRYFWAKNQTVLAQIPPLVHIFSKKNIPCLLLKGAGLTLLCYNGDAGVRPMTDLDLLVPQSHVSEAMGILEEAGWKQDSAFKRGYHPHMHAAHFTLPSGVDVDLHWHVLPHRAESFYDDFFWQNTVSVTFQGDTYHTLNPTMHLVHNCIHGAMWNSVKTVRWISDACTLISRTPIDWQHFLNIGQKLDMLLPLRGMVQYLKYGLRVPIPDFVLSELNTFQATAWQVREHRLITRPQGFLGPLPLLWARSTREIDFYRKIPVFLKYLRTRYSADSVFELSLTLAKKKWNRTFKK